VFTPDPILVALITMRVVRKAKRRYPRAWREVNRKRDGLGH